MNRNKKIAKVLFSIALLTFLPSNAMRVAFAERFRAGMRGAHWMLLISPAVNAFSAYQQDLKNKQISDNADKDVVEFVRSSLKEQGYDPDLVDGIKITKGNGDFFSNSIHFSINVPFNSALLAKVTRMEQGTQEEYEKKQKEVDKLKPPPEVLIKIKMNDEEVENLYQMMGYPPVDAQSHLLWQAIIGHEGAHILNNDTQRKSACSAAAPLVGHAVINGTTMPLRSVMRQWLHNNAQSTAWKVARGVGYLPSALAKLFVGIIFEHAHSKYREHLADEEVRKRVRDPEILYATAAERKWRHKQTQDLLSRMMLEDVLSPEGAKVISYKGNLKELFERYPILYEIVVPTSSKQWQIDTHPSDLDRAQRFEAAAKELEKRLAEKQSEKETNNSKVRSI
jgi:hypothetical protein